MLYQGKWFTTKLGLILPTGTSHHKTLYYRVESYNQMKVLACVPITDVVP